MALGPLPRVDGRLLAPAGPGLRGRGLRQGVLHDPPLVAEWEISGSRVRDPGVERVRSKRGQPVGCVLAGDVLHLELHFLREEVCALQPGPVAEPDVHPHRM